MSPRERRVDSPLPRGSLKTRTRGKNQPQPPAGRKYPSVVAHVGKQQEGREPRQTEDQKVLIRSSRQRIRQERQREEQSPVRQLATEDFPTGSQADANMAQPSGSSSKGKRKRMDSSSLRKKSKSDDESIIEVTDDGDSPSPALRSGSAVEDHTKLLEFPPDGKDRLTVTLADYRTLEHDTFLNDIIIDFYLQFLNDKLPAEDKKTVHIFKTMF